MKREDSGGKTVFELLLLLAHPCNPSTPEVEAGRAGVLGPPGLVGKSGQVALWQSLLKTRQIKTSTLSNMKYMFVF